MESAHKAQVHMMWTNVAVRAIFITGACYCFTHNWNAAGGWMVFGAIVCGLSWERN